MSDSHRFNAEAMDREKIEKFAESRELTDEQRKFLGIRRGK